MVVAAVPRRQIPRRERNEVPPPFQRMMNWQVLPAVIVVLIVPAPAVVVPAFSTIAAAAAAMLMSRFITLPLPLRHRCCLPAFYERI